MLQGGGQAAGGIFAAAVSVLGSLWAAAQSTVSLARDTVDACSKLVPPSGQALVHTSVEKGELIVDVGGLISWVAVTVAVAFVVGWLIGRQSSTTVPVEFPSSRFLTTPLPSIPPPPPAQRGKTVGASPLSHYAVDARYL